MHITSRRRLTGLVGAVLAAGLVLLLAQPVGAVGDGGVLIEAGAEEVDRGAMAAVVTQARSDGVDLSVAVLAAEPAGGAEAEADRLVDRAGGVVLVISPEEVGAVSVDHSDADVDRALDALFDRLDADGDLVAATQAFAGALEGRGGGGGTGGGGGGGSGVVVLLVIAAIVVGVVLLLRRRGRGGGGQFGGGGPQFGHRGYGGRRRGGFGSAAAGGFIGSALGNRVGRSTSRSSRTSRSTGRSSTSRSRGSASRSRRSGGSRGGGSRRR